MKKTIFLAYLALLLCFLPPLLELGARGTPGPSAAPEAESSLAPGDEAPAPEAEALTASAAPAQIRLLLDGQTQEMDMQDYLLGVLAAEMPASFELEALKAQAVAARTYALYCTAAHKHEQADICTDYRCCQAWQDEQTLRESWGENYEDRRQKLRRAVEETAGEYLSYEGQPVFAAFHASSAGATEDCGQVWSPRPYLISVSSPESAETVPGYVSELLCAPLDFRDVLLSAYPEADFTGPEESWIGTIQLDDSGRVASAALGGVEIPGTKLRSLFSLRSTAFTLVYRDGHFLFTVTGHGHGVGMSQYGANIMAAEGSGYREILSHYYPGTALVS